MSVPKVLPLGMTRAWYGDGFGVYAMLARDDVTSIPDTAKTYNEVYTYELSEAGGYRAGGLTMGAVARVEGAGVVEWDTGTAVWTSAETVTVSGFRWIVLMTNGPQAPIIAVHDLGTTQSLTGQQLALRVTESTYSPGIYPILRMKRALT